MTTTTEHTTTTRVVPRTVGAREGEAPPPEPPKRSEGRTGPPTPRPIRNKRRPSELTSSDVLTGVGAAASALACTWLVFTQLTQGVGWFGFLLATYAVFIVIFALVTADRLGRLVATDRTVTVLIYSAGVALLVPLLWLVGYVVVRGAPALRPHFFSQDQRGVGPTKPASDGGGLHAIIGSLEQVALALVISLPLAVCVAVFLNETRSRFRRPVRIMIDAMSGLPSIVAGLFIFAVLVLPYGKRITLFGYDGFMASLALAMVMMPTITRTIEVVVRLVPDGLREASLALGSSRARTVWSVVLPTARTGVVTAVVLGIARAVGETAPLLLTSFGADLSNSNPFRDPQESLPLFVWRNIQKPSQAAVDRGFTGAFVLMLVVLSLFAVARVVGRPNAGHRFRRRRAPRLDADRATQEALP